MEGHTIAHTVLVACTHPLAQQVALRPDIYGVPGLVLRVPQVVVVVVYALNHQKSCTGFLIERRQILWVEFRGVPCTQHVLVAHLRRVAVAFQVVVVSLVSFLIQVAGVPVTAFTSGLRAEVYPDAELCIAQPLRRAGIVLFY